MGDGEVNAETRACIRTHDPASAVTVPTREEKPVSAEPTRDQQSAVAASSDPAELTGRWVYLRDTGAGVLTGAARTSEGRWHWSLRTPEGEVEGTGFPHVAPLRRYPLPPTRRARHHLRALRADLAEYAPEAVAERNQVEHDLDLLTLELAAQP